VRRGLRDRVLLAFGLALVASAVVHLGAYGAIDPAAIRVVPWAGVTTSERGTEADFEVSLASAPDAPVQIAFFSEDPGEVVVEPPVITFTPEDWERPREVTVRGVDDGLRDGDQRVRVVTAPAVSEDASYHALDPADVIVTNLDDEHDDDDAFVELMLDEEEEEVAPTEDDVPDAPDPDPEPERRVARVEPEPEPDPPERRQPQPEPEEEEEEHRRHRPRAEAHAITQRSQDPSVPPPEDARFVARENNRVEEETVARLRNLVRDDEQLQEGPQMEPAEEPDPGNADEQLAAQLREMEGSDVREATPEEAQQERPREASRRPPPNVRAGGDNTPRSEDEGRAASAEARRARAAMGGGARVEYETITVNDGFGEYTIRVPRRRPEGEGEGDEGGRRVEARRGRTGERSRARRGRGRGRGATGPDLRVSWNQFQEVYTEEELAREREAYLEERRSRSRGRERQRRWADFRAALENYTPGVRPGNQTALNAAASPFAEYISAVHRRIHPRFAERFIAGLPQVSDSPYSDMSLRTKLEIILNRDGTVHRVGIVNTSGFLPFDYGAYSAVMSAQPYPAAPEQILSGDGRVYVHWGFYRNGRQCGTFNAEPYVLPNPPGSPQPGGGPLQDGLRDDALVPTGSDPTWGEEPAEESPEEPDEESDERPAEPPAEPRRPDEVMG